MTTRPGASGAFSIHTHGAAESRQCASLLLGIALAGVACGAAADTRVVRVLSLRTFSGTFNDGKDHPVMVVDDVSRPRPIGPGRGAGGYVFLNNKLVDWDSGKHLGMMHGVCLTVDHGPDGPWQGPVVLGAGGPFPSMCHTSYVFEDGQIVAMGVADLNAMEKDVPQPRPIVGGSGRYFGAIGQVTIVQDPPGQPITYKAVLEFQLPAKPASAAALR